MVDRRAFVVAEIISTEQAYVDDLELIIYDYKQEAEKTPLDVSPDFWQVVFSNIVDLHEIACEFHAALEANDPDIGHCFQHICNYASAYLIYCTNFKEASELLASTKAANPKLQQWLIERQMATHKGLGLDAYLIKPVQRLLKYPLLLKELAKCMPEDDPELSVVQHALGQLQDIAEQINEAQREKDEFDAMIARIEEMPVSFAKGQNGTLLVEDEGIEHDGFKTKRRHLMLFDLTLVVCKPQSASMFGGDRPPFLYRYAIKLSRVQIRSLEKPPNAWEAVCGPRTWVFSHFTPKARDQFVTMVMVALVKLTYARLSSRPPSRTSVTSDSETPPSVSQDEDWSQEVNIASKVNIASDYSDRLENWASSVSLTEVQDELEKRRTRFTAETRVQQGLEAMLTQYKNTPQFGTPEAVAELETRLEETCTLLNGLQSDIDVLERHIANHEPQDEQVLFATVLYDFVAREEGELSIQEGQQVKVIKQCDENGDPAWLYVEIDAETGYIPSNYVEIQEPQPVTKDATVAKPPSRRRSSGADVDVMELEERREAAETSVRKLQKRLTEGKGSTSELRAELEVHEQTATTIDSALSELSPQPPSSDDEEDDTDAIARDQEIKETERDQQRAALLSRKASQAATTDSDFNKINRETLQPRQRSQTNIDKKNRRLQDQLEALRQLREQRLSKSSSQLHLKPGALLGIEPIIIRPKMHCLPPPPPRDIGRVQRIPSRKDAYINSQRQRMSPITPNPKPPPLPMRTNLPSDTNSMRAPAVAPKVTASVVSGKAPALPPRSSDHAPVLPPRTSGQVPTLPPRSRPTSTSSGTSRQTTTVITPKRK